MAKASKGLFVKREGNEKRKIYDGEKKNVTENIFLASSFRKSAGSAGYEFNEIKNGMFDDFAAEFILLSRN